MKILAFVSLVVLSLTTVPAYSDKRPGGLQLVGEAQLDVLLWSVYRSQLYSPDGTYRADMRPLRLRITYLRDFKANALVKQTEKEWQQLGRNHPNQEQWLASLETLWPDIRSQDTLSLDLGEDEVSRFYHNDQLLGRITDPDFGEQFLAIWLSPNTSRPALRRALIGGDS